MKWVERVAFIAALGVVSLVIAWTTDHTTRPTPLALVATADGTRLGLSKDRRQQLFRQMIRMHRHWSDKARAVFADHPWSRFDATNNHLRNHINALAERTGLSYTTLALILDEGTQHGWPGPGGRSLPPTIISLDPRTE